MSIEENKAVIRRYVEELWTAGNLDVADEIIHPNTRNPRGSTVWANGPESVKDHRANHPFAAGSPDLRRTTHDMIAEGDKVVLYSTYSGTYTEDNASGIAPTGEAWEMKGVATFVVEDGKIVEEPWGNTNTSAVFQQLAKAAVRQFVEKIWNEGDLEAADQYIASDYVRHDPATPEDVQGIDGFKEVVALYRAALPDLHLEIEDIIAGGDKGETVALRWSGTGTHEGELMGVAPTGKQVNSSGNTFLRLENGRIAEEWVQWDNLGLLQQIGAMSAEG